VHRQSLHEAKVLLKHCQHTGGSFGRAGSVPTAGSGKSLVPNSVPLTANMKWRVAEWEDKLRSRAKIILETISIIIFVRKRSALDFFILNIAQIFIFCGIE